MPTRVAASAVLFVVVALLSAPSLQSESDLAVPHFNLAPPAKGEKLPPILTKDQFWGANAQYLYNSLHSCFAGAHGAQCGTCLK